MKMAATSSSSDSKSKGKKKLDNLLSSFDLLSSHLGTTFTALSTALARSQAGAQSKAHFAILFGPTVSAASAATTTRARILLEIVGFEVKIWGTRSDVVRNCYHDGDGEEEEEEEEAPPDSDGEEDGSEDGSVTGDLEEESEEEVPSTPESSESESEEEDDENEGTCIPSSSSYVPSEPDIVNAERVLSRTLAQANADASAGMAAEIRMPDLIYFFYSFF